MPSGTIENRDRAKQLLLFDGLYHEDGCYPTDIDISRDYRTSLLGKRGRLVIMGDAKYMLKDLGEGQRIHVELIASAFDAINVPFYFVVARHQVHNTEDDVSWKADCYIDQVYHDGSWRADWRGKTFGEFEQTMALRHGVIRRTA